MTEFDKALHDPSTVYAYPKEVLSDASMTDEQKLQILQRWRYDAYELLVADEENMAGESPTMFSRVNRAIAILKGELDPDTSSE